MTIRITVLLAFGLLLTAIQSPVNGQCEKDCTQKETCFKKHFDGESTKGWRGFQKDHTQKRVIWTAGSRRQGVVQEYSDQGTLNY